MKLVHVSLALFRPGCLFLVRVSYPCVSGLKQRASCARLLLLHFHPRRFRVGGLGPDATPAAKTEVMRV